MKHLTKYKLFESVSKKEHDEIIETLEDIGLDLKDDGYGIRVHGNYVHNGSSKIVVDVHLTKGGSYVPIKYREVKETFDRMDSYMKSIGFKSHLEYFIQKFSGGYMQSYIPSDNSTLKTNLFAIIFDKKR